MKAKVSDSMEEKLRIYKPNAVPRCTNESRVDSTVVQTSSDESAGEVRCLSKNVDTDEEIKGQNIQPAQAAAKLLQVSRSELDDLFVNTQKMQARSWQIIQSLLDDLNLRTCQTVTTALGSFDKEIRRLVSYQKSVMLESLDVEAQARMAARTEESLAKAKDTQAGVEQGLTDLVTEKRRTLDAVLASSAEELQRREASLRGDVRHETQQALDELKNRIAEVAKDFRQMEEEVSNEFEKRLEQTLQRYKSSLDELGEKVVDAAEKRISEMTRSSVASVAEFTREIVERELSESFIKGVRKRLDHFADVLKQINPDALDAARGK